MIAPPLALYVHLPWCIRKCPYCDFNSYALRGALPEQEYVDALARDIEAQACKVSGRVIESVFFGGGTPSLFAPEAIGRILDVARRHLRIAHDAEVTLEANPGTVERGRFHEYRAAGVNRVSLGAQSFDDVRLGVLGRIHSADETRHAAAELHAAGIANFNLDLMYALPGQDRAGALADVEAALALAPAHVSHYQLTIEAGTVFAARPPTVPSEDMVDAMLDASQERLGTSGFVRYEVSAYARPGSRCRHNLNYWQFGDYVGVGAGAHGKRTDVPIGQIVRTRQPREPRRYVASVPAGCVEQVVPAADRPFEFMLNALRLVEGFAPETFTEHTGVAWQAVSPKVAVLASRGLLQVEEGLCRASPLGLRFLNDVVSAFLPSASPRTSSTALSTLPPVGDTVIHRQMGPLRQMSALHAKPAKSANEYSAND